MTDLDRMGADFSLPQSRGMDTRISGNVPAASIRNYHRELIGYTHGKGKLTCTFSGYGLCKNSETVIENIGYNCDSDIENTADSVFCSHGAGFNVKWNEVKDYMHLESILKPQKENDEVTLKKQTGSAAVADDELIRIFERTYGKVETKIPDRKLHTQKEKPYVYKPQKTDNRKEYSRILG